MSWNQRPFWDDPDGPLADLVRDDAVVRAFAHIGLHGNISERDCLIEMVKHLAHERARLLGIITKQAETSVAPILIHMKESGSCDK